MSEDRWRPRKLAPVSLEHERIPNDGTEQMEKWKTKGFDGRVTPEHAAEYERFRPRKPQGSIEHER